MKNNEKKIFVFLTVTVVSLMLLSSFSGCVSQEAQPQQPEYPTKPITLICPWAAGGGTDRTSRMIATLLEQELGVPVNVINKVGGGGTIGHSAAATASPDGYTIGVITFELSTFKHLGVADVSYEDFEPICQYNFDPAAVIVRADAPWNSLQELLDYIKAHPGELKASGTARGGVWDLARIGLLNAAGIPPDALPWIPSTGAAPALQELIAGGIDVTTCSLPEAGPLIDAGKVKALAVMAPERNPAYPDVPTLREAGIDWDGMGAWRGLAAPKGTPDYVIETIASAMEKIVQSDEWKDFMEKNGFGMEWKGPEEFAKFLENDYQVVGELIKSAGYA
jgi:tripartite-type tricarboxylate transporter receptor subunit TctC